MGRDSEGVRINKLFKPLYTSKKRYFLITGGRGSLKSSTVHDFVARLTYQQGQGILFTRYTMTSAEKSIIPEFKIVLERLQIEPHFHITKNVITNTQTGSFIYFSGIKTSSGDQTATLKSIAGITTWIIEEGEDFKNEKTFETIDDSIRTTHLQNRVIWIQNPTTKEHFIYNKLIAPKNKKVQVHGYDVTVSDMEDVEHIHTTYHIATEYLNDSWLKKAEKHRLKAEEAENKYKTHYYHNYIGGWLERAEGVIFEHWKEGVFDESLPYCYGLDEGYSPDPATLVKIAIDHKRKIVYWKELFYETELATGVLLGKIKDSISRRKDLIIADDKGRLIADGRNIGLNMIKPYKYKDSVSGGIKKMLDYTHVIDKESYNIKREMNNYVWNDKKASIPVDDFNHSIDAGRYAFERLLLGKKTGVRRRN